ncbi:MAG: 2-oxoacid:acceptor oxidoreductase family protein [Pseudomonadota bacterium]
MSEDTRPILAVALLGSGGAGIATAGEILLETARRAGYYGKLTRSFGPQIRGGETASFVQLSIEPEAPPISRYDLVAALDWKNAERFAAELPTGPATRIVAAADAGEGPTLTGVVAEPLALREAARNTGVRENLQLLAVLCGWLGLSLGDLLDVASQRFRTRFGEASRALLADRIATPRPTGIPRLLPPENGDGSWNINGNEATGLGLLQAGIRMAAAYPITPATELLEWLSPRLEGLGGLLVQAEDELASINMAVGASFGGVPAMTATSGPGLALMHEGIGLAVAAEIPLVVVNVQRGGPSTGLPTKSEQADLLTALFGPHGDAPHVVVAPLGITDCTATAGWAVSLAEQLQTPVILQSEQRLAQTRIVCPPIDAAPAAPARARPTGDTPYQRYADTPAGISPIAKPGDADTRYVADGLEHDQDGTPTTAAAAHELQTSKRQRKLVQHDFGDLAFASEGPDDADVVLIATGSLFPTARAALSELASAGVSARAVGLRLLAPAQPALLAKTLGRARRVLVIEQSAGAQLFHYLRG